MVWGMLGSTYPNVLLVGEDAAVEDILDGLVPTCRQPVQTCENGSVLPMSLPADGGALILRDVGNLTDDGQRRLMEWLDSSRRGRTQVIATSAVALWPQVVDGSFAAALYYRLNVIYLDLADGAKLVAGR